MKKEIITMRQWKYTLKNSKSLRNAIKNENYLEILKELIKSYKQIVKIEIKMVSYQCLKKKIL